MSTFYVDCMWIATGTVIVEAETAQDAADIALNEGRMPEQHEILDESYRVMDVNTAQ